MRNYTQESLTWYNKYQERLCSEEEYILNMWDIIESYAKYLLQKSGMLIKYPELYEDFLSEAKVLVIGKLMDYDPSEGAPSTFFKKYIIQAFRQTLPRDFAGTDYYEGVSILINRIAKKAGYEDFSEAPLPEIYKAVQENSDISFTTLKKTVNYKKITTCSLDVLSENNDDIVNDIFASPEEQIEKTQMQSCVVSIFNNMDPFTRFCVNYTILEPYMLNGAMTYMSKRQLEIAFNSSDPEKRKKLHPALRDLDPKELSLAFFPDEKKITQDDIQRAINRLTAIRSNPAISMITNIEIAEGKERLDYGDVGNLEDFFRKEEEVIA